VQKANSFFAPGGMAGMGWAVPAALGVKLARPDQPVVAVAGDGGFMMTISSLATAVDHGIPMVAVVMNDTSLGMVRHHQETPVASTFAPTDHARIAEGFGALGFRVEDSRDLPEAVKEAQASRRPCVIDVMIDREASPDIYRAGTRVATET
jgi:acetolactate synthase I/II/III large subunit